jgi:hypothetical protein
MRFQSIVVGSLGDWDWRGNKSALRISSKGWDVLVLLFGKAGRVAM